MKKQLNNTVLGTVEINRVDAVRVQGEEYKSIVFTPINWTERSRLHTVAPYAFTPEKKSAISAARDLFLGKWNVEEKFHLYSQQSDILRTTTIGLVQTTHSNIIHALNEGSRMVMLNVPGYGTIHFEMPLKRTDNGYIVAIDSPWLSMRTTGVGTGKLIATDTNERFAMHTLHYHNVINALSVGDRVVVDCTWRQNRQTLEWNSEVHDLAVQVFTLLTDENLDPKSYLLEQKELAREYKDNRRTQFFGQVVENNVQVNGEEADLNSATIVIINGGEPIDAMAVPNGDYLFADENGNSKRIPYSVSRNSDRRGLRMRGEVVRLITQ